MPLALSRLTPKEALSPLKDLLQMKDQKTQLIKAAGIPNETQYRFRNESGFEMDINEISFTSMGLSWGQYRNPSAETVVSWSGRYDITTHFDLPATGPGLKTKSTRGCEFTIYRESAQPYDVEIDVTQNQTRHFFEVSVNEHIFQKMHSDDSAFTNAFSDHRAINQLSTAFTARITPTMLQVIHDMGNHPYTGCLKHIYLETCAIKLLIAQVYQLDHQRGLQPALKPHDADTLNDLKSYIDSNLFTPMSVIALARKAGINQTKLKAGFKQLFNCTLFEYIRDQRLQQVVQMLTDNRLTINEIACAIGYQHPQHFTAAFKRKYGVVPSLIKVNY